MVKLLNVKQYINIKAMISENIFAVCSVVGSVIFFFMGFFFGRYDKKKENSLYKDIYEDYIKQQYNTDE